MKYEVFKEQKNKTQKKKKTVKGCFVKKLHKANVHKQNNKEHILIIVCSFAEPKTCARKSGMFPSNQLQELVNTQMNKIIWLYQPS